LVERCRRRTSSIVDTAGVFHGRDALRDALRELQEAFEELSFEAEKFIEAPDGEVVVFIRARGRGRGSRVEIDNRIAHLWTYAMRRPFGWWSTRSKPKRSKQWG
jgi:ketosteroid isomerase-like protein